MNYAILSFGDVQAEVLEWELTRPQWHRCPCCRGTGEVVRDAYRIGDYLRMDQCGLCEGFRCVRIGKWMDFHNVPWFHTFAGV